MNTIDDRLPTTSVPLKLQYPSKDSINIISCLSYKSPSGKYIWATTGLYKDTILNYSGGDSVITINLTIHNSSVS